MTDPVAKGTTVKGTIKQLVFGLLLVVLALLVAVALTGCGTIIPPPPQLVSVPVPASCLPTTLPQRPKISTDAELSALDDYKFALEIFIDRRRLLDYTSEIEAVLSGCR